MHRTLRAQLEAKRAWVEQLAQAVSGRKMTVVARESEAASAPPAATPTIRLPSGAPICEARAKAEPAVQAVLDVFGGEIEDVEEI